MLYGPSHSDSNSPEMHERLTAVSELVGSTDQASLDTLVRLTGDVEQRVAIASIRAIGSRRDETAFEQLKQIAANSDNGALQGCSAAELGRFKRTDYRLLTDILLNGKDPEARAGAALGLKRLRDAESVNSLVKAMSDTDANVRGIAFEALGRTTGRWFKFDPNAPLAARAKSIATIKKKLTTTKSPQDH